MRPLPVEPIEGAPAFVLGLSIIRGQPTPVVHLAALLGAPDAQAMSRFVTLRLGNRRLALAVASVEGIRELDRADLEPLPKILGPDGSGSLESIGQLDGQLLVVLNAMSILPESLWQRMRAGSTAPS